MDGTISVAYFYAKNARHVYGTCCVSITMISDQIYSIYIYINTLDLTLDTWLLAFTHQSEELARVAEWFECKTTLCSSIYNVREFHFVQFPHLFTRRTADTDALVVVQNTPSTLAAAHLKRKTFLHTI